MTQIKFALLLLAFALPLFANDEADLRALDRGIVTATAAQDATWSKDGWKYAAGHASAINIKRTKETS